MTPGFNRRSYVQGMFLSLLFCVRIHLYFSHPDMPDGRNIGLLVRLGLNPRGPYTYRLSTSSSRRVL